MTLSTKFMRTAERIRGLASDVSQLNAAAAFVAAANQAEGPVTTDENNEVVATLITRYDTATNLTEEVPSTGQLVFDTTNKVLKRGDGTTAFPSLPALAWEELQPQSITPATVPPVIDLNRGGRYTIAAPEGTKTIDLHKTSNVYSEHPTLIYNGGEDTITLQPPVVNTFISGSAILSTAGSPISLPGLSLIRFEYFAEDIFCVQLNTVSA